MARKGSPLDPGLKSLLDSIRQTVGGDAPPAAPAEADAGPASQPPAPPRALPPGSRSVEEFLADLIRPQVAAWLDAHLPEIVQKLAAEEIRRLTGK